MNKTETNETVTDEGKSPRKTVSEIVARVLSYDPDALGRSWKSIAAPVEAGKPNVELFDDPQHVGQYWGD
jgi:hypothetical protein